MPSPRPSRADLLAAAGKTVPDVARPGLKVLFCGINPGLYTAAIGHHFGRPGNRFWPTLHAAGFTPRLFDPSEEQLLLPLGYGITNVVERATAAADELTDEEIRLGGVRLVEKVKALAPAYLAVLGVGAYRVAFAKRKAAVGEQAERIGATRVWALPNPSGLNAYYNHTLPAIFREFRQAVADHDGLGQPPDGGLLG
ncbi:MAG TPA: G/U mismatch-specific DNA glycosylase [Urbifossiella sp.]|jgi:TDG/mug DNA glycosylase family protein|nr:G/U mismatch-specific DNA glycosylase [Urbifossiella sp.]